MEEVDWQSVARRLQMENEDLRINFLKNSGRKRSLDIDFGIISKFIEDHYIAVLVLLAVVYYTSAIIIDIAKVRKV